jgi:hypothetical protein
MFINSGNTPATDIVGGSNVQEWSRELPNEFNFGDIESDKKGQAFPQVAGPKFAFVSPQTEITLDDMIESREKKHHHVYAWGWVSYKDGIKSTPRRLTEYCFELVNFRASTAMSPAEITVPDMHSLDHEFAWDFIGCPLPHNCYDENCKDYPERTRGLP